MGEKVKVLFIIPAHENNDCLEDTINNVIKFNSDIDPLFALHIRPLFKDFDSERFERENLVWMYAIDSTRNQKYESQLSPILRTYDLAKKSFGEDFEYVKIFHTSELFLKYGFLDYIKSYDTGYDTRTDGIPSRYNPIYDMKLFDNITSKILYQCVELSYYRKQIFDKVYETARKFPITLDQLHNFFNFTPIEEIVIPTLSVHYSESVGRNTGVIIENLSSFNLEDWQFSIKSVPRDINHPLRVKARQL